MHLGDRGAGPGRLDGRVGDLFGSDGHSGMPADRVARAQVTAQVTTTS